MRGAIFHGHGKQMRETMKAMKPGDSFVVTHAQLHRMAYNAAWRVRIRITTRKIHGVGWLVKKIG